MTIFRIGDRIEDKAPDVLKTSRFFDRTSHYNRAISSLNELARGGVAERCNKLATLKSVKLQTRFPLHILFSWMLNHLCV